MESGNGSVSLPVALKLTGKLTSRLHRPWNINLIEYHKKYALLVLISDKFHYVLWFSVQCIVSKMSV